MRFDFDECIKQLLIAQRAIPAKDHAKTSEALSKTQEIVDTLSVSLDMSYPISKQLRPMYSFLSQQAMQASIAGSSLALVPASHLSNLEAPQAFEQAVLDFLAHAAKA